jgi:hypothetical protein
LNLRKGLFVCHQVAEFCGEEKKTTSCYTRKLKIKTLVPIYLKKMSTLLLNETGDRGLVDSMKTRQEQSQTQSALIRPITQQVSIDKIFTRGYFWSNL